MSCWRAFRVSANSLAVLLTATAMTGPAPTASAHGPCSECISPNRGPAGTSVRVGWTAVKVIWNPNRSQDTYGLLQDAYHADERSVVLFRAEKPRRSRFRVPQVAPGRYAIAQYDGSEGGTHYTWAYFTVLPAAQRLPGGARDNATAGDHDDSSPWLWAIPAGIVALVLAVTACRRWQRPRSSPPPGG